MGKDAPPMPDYGQLAKDQGANNRETAVAQSLMNNPNMVTPFGSSTYTGPTDGSGRPTVTQTLDPADESLRNRMNEIKANSLNTLFDDSGNIRNALMGSFGLAGGPMQGLDSQYAPQPGAVQTDAGLGQAGPLQTGLNFDGAPGMPVADDQTRQNVSDALYQQGAQYLDPQFQQAQDALTTNLANQGITQGSTAGDRAQHNLDLQKQQAYGNLVDQATQSGIGAMNTLFGEQMGARQQGVGETAAQGQFTNASQQQAINELLSSLSANNSGVGLQGQLGQASEQATNAGRAQAYQEYASNRTMPINLLTGLLNTSQIQTPQFQPTTPTSITPAPIMQGGLAQGQASTAIDSANAGMWGNILGGISGVAAAGIKSDRRLKSNIKRIGNLRPGIDLYSYIISGEPTIGVMADEVEKVIPEAVSTGEDGFKRVNYSMLGAQ